MEPAEIESVAIALRDDLKLARKARQASKAPLNFILDDLINRYNGFSPKYETYGKVLRPYATSLEIQLRENDIDLHKWISSSLENLRKGAAPALAVLIVAHLLDKRYDFIISQLARIDNPDIVSRLPESIKTHISLYRVEAAKVALPLSIMDKQTPENISYHSLKDGFNPRDWDIAHHRIAEEKSARSGRLTLANLDIDSLPDELFELEWLEYLDFCRSIISHVGPLGKLRNLKTLDCSYNPLKHLPSFEGCKSLHTVWCGVTEIKDLGSIAKCDSLTTLYCGRTKISDLAPLAGCKNLRNFHCDQTDVVSLVHLGKCDELEIIDCLDTKITSISDIGHKPKLRALILSGCHLSDPSVNVWRMPSLNSVILDRGSITGVPQSVLSRSYNDNCIARLRAHFGISLE